MSLFLVTNDEEKGLIATPIFNKNKAFIPELQWYFSLFIKYLYNSGMNLFCKRDVLVVGNLQKHLALNNFL